MPTGCSEKTWHVPGHLDGHVQVLGYAQHQERPEQTLLSHLWLTLRSCESSSAKDRKYRINAFGNFCLVST